MLHDLVYSWPQLAMGLPPAAWDALITSVTYMSLSCTHVCVTWQTHVWVFIWLLNFKVTPDTLPPVNFLCELVLGCEILQHLPYFSKMFISSQFLVMYSHQRFWAFMKQTMIVVVQRFDHAGLHQVQKTGPNVVPLQSLFATWMLKTVDDYISETIAMSFYDILVMCCVLINLYRLRLLSNEALSQTRQSLIIKFCSEFHLPFC